MKPLFFHRLNKTFDHNGRKIDSFFRHYFFLGCARAYDSVLSWKAGSVLKLRFRIELVCPAWYPRAITARDTSSLVAVYWDNCSSSFAGVDQCCGVLGRVCANPCQQNNNTKSRRHTFTGESADQYKPGSSSQCHQCSGSLCHRAW